MGLLDQLLEKKDVLAYIDFRIKSLKCDLSKTNNNIYNCTFIGGK